MEHDIRSIYEQFLAGKCSREDLEILLAHFANGGIADVDQRMQGVLDQESPLSTAQLKAMEPVFRHNWTQIRRRLEADRQQELPVETLPQPDSKSMRPWYRYRTVSSVAAVLVLCCAAVLAWYLWGRTVPTDPLSVPGLVFENGISLEEDIDAGAHRAVLTLSDGRQIVLSDAHSGIINDDEGIKYNDGSSLELSPGEGGRENLKDIPALTTNYYVLTTPNGGTYQVTLPDGSTVWLNAGSTLKYPNRFDGEERVVELEGEAYFEVVRSRKDAKSQSRDGSVATQRISASAYKPFRVLSNGQTIEVLGTEFNVSAYAGEHLSTTLVHGSVRVGRGEAQVVLSPGQQAHWNDQRLERKQVDVTPFVAWKSGWFMFHDLPLREILPQLARWYDVEIDDRNLGNTSRLYYGEISRAVPLSAVLEMLAADGSVRFELKGGILFVR